MTVPQVPIRWRKSTWSGEETSCVELAHTLTALRDSKNPAGPVLTVGTLSLLNAVKAGWLDSR